MEHEHDEITDDGEAFARLGLEQRQRAAIGSATAARSALLIFCQSHGATGRASAHRPRPAFRATRYASAFVGVPQATTTEHLPAAAG